MTTNKHEFSASRQFCSWLIEHNVSLSFSTYQVGRLFFVGMQDSERMSVFERTFARCMGIGLIPKTQSLWVANLYQLWRFENALKPRQDHQGFDRIYVPQVGYTTGDVDAHDVAIDDQGVLFVNNQFSCLARDSDTHSFEPIWQPLHISKLAAEDC